MKMTRTAAFLTVFAVLAAASNTVASAASSHVPDYDCEDSPTPVRAFIYADHTVIQLDSYSSALAVKDDSGGTIGFARDGRFARLDGKLNHFTALVNGEPVRCSRHGWTQPQLIRLSLPAVPAPASGAAGAGIAPIAASAALGLDANEKVVAVASPARSASAPKAASGAAVPPILASNAEHASGASSPAAVPVPVAAPAAVGASGPSADVATVTLAASGAVVSSPAIEVPKWTLRQGHVVSRELQEIGGHFGWHIDWLYPREIVVPADTSYSGDFTQVATAAINTLKSNGLLINATFYNGNKFLVVRGAGTTPQ